MHLVFKFTLFFFLVLHVLSNAEITAELTPRETELAKELRRLQALARIVELHTPEIGTHELLHMPVVELEANAFVIIKAQTHLSDWVLQYSLQSEPRFCPDCFRYVFMPTVCEKTGYRHVDHWEEMLDDEPC